MRGQGLVEYALILVLVAVVVIVVLSLLGAGTSSTGHPFTQSQVQYRGQMVDRVELTWVMVNPPPGSDGPCYSYFHTESFGGKLVGYSGVYCQQ